MGFDSDDLAKAAQIHKLDQQILQLCAELASKYRGRLVRITNDWRVGAKGAVAKIDGCICHSGRILFLCMVLKKDGTIRNSDAWTREYRPISDFEFVDGE